MDSSLHTWSGEAGGHRFQRIPPTERRGRVHTSTVTVAALREPQRGKLAAPGLADHDLKVSWFSGTGKGGQNRNKVQASCRLLHVPTGIEAKAECRTRETSYKQALQALTERIAASAAKTEADRHASVVKAQVGSGMRGDKIRTYRLQDDFVTDHRTGARARWADVERGIFPGLW